MIPLSVLKVLPQQRRPGLRASLPGDEDSGTWPGAACDSAHSQRLRTVQLCERQQEAEEPLIIQDSPPFPFAPPADKGEKCFSAQASSHAALREVSIVDVVLFNEFRNKSISHCKRMKKVSEIWCLHTFTATFTSKRALKTRLSLFLEDVLSRATPPGSGAISWCGTEEVERS